MRIRDSKPEISSMVLLQNTVVRSSLLSQVSWFVSMRECILKTSRREKPRLKAKTFISMRACILKTVCLIGEITVIITTEKIAGKESGSMKKIIAASKNHHKIREIGEITSKYGLETVSRDDAGVPDIEIEEDGSSFEENSFKKANEIMKITGEIAIADDSGLEVEYLGGAPGIYPEMNCFSEDPLLSLPSPLSQWCIRTEKSWSQEESVTVISFRSLQVTAGSDTIPYSSPTGIRERSHSLAEKRRIKSATGRRRLKNLPKC